MITIDDLSDEVILSIFRQLDLKDLIPLLSVSHRWRQIASDRSLYSIITITEGDPIAETTFILKQHRRSIRQIHIIEHGNIEFFVSLIRGCCNLEILSIKLCNSNGESIQDTIKSCKRLHSITLQHTPTITKLNELFEVLSTRTMKKINIRNMNYDIGENDLYKLTNVQDLRLKSVIAHSDAIYKFCLNNATSLKTLKLIVSDESWMSQSKNPNDMFKAIGSCEKLITLCLGPQVISNLNDESFSHFYQLNSLVVFEIHNAVGVSAETFRKFFLRPSSVKLQKVSLYKCQSVNSSVLQSIATNCRTLQKFTLEKSKLTKNISDLDDLVLFVQKCKKLRRLYLFGFHIQVSQVLHLMPQYLPELESLKYSNSDEPMKVLSFLSLLQDLMPEFEVCGLQWTFSLYVHCKRKRINQKVYDFNPVCAQALKISTPICS